MQLNSPGEVELYSYYSAHLGPRFETAGLRVQFHYNQTPGLHVKAAASEEYKESILRRLQDGLALRFPEFPKSGSVWVTEITEHKVDSSQRAFYRVARLVIEQAFALANLAQAQPSAAAEVPLRGTPLS